MGTGVRVGSAGVSTLGFSSWSQLLLLWTRRWKGCIYTRSPAQASPGQEAADGGLLAQPAGAISDRHLLLLS